MIISASRRTDIPAFYSDWFINRIKAGFLLTKNPFNAHQVKKVSLLPSDVDAIVFWTRNPAKLLKHLPLLDSLNYRYYFQYTITGYGKELETATIHPQKAIDTFKMLSDRIGRDRVIWRYDPIIMSNLTSLAEHLRLFEKIARNLAGYTNKVVISFADLYQKTEVNLNKVEGLQYYDVLHNKSELFILCKGLSDIAKCHGMKIETCAEGVDINHFGIENGKCIDSDLLKKLFDIDVSSTKDSGQRLDCGCIKSVDIGTYNTCLHGCTYCYATSQKKTAHSNYKKHDPKSPFLIGSAEGWEHLLDVPIPVQSTLF